MILVHFNSKPLPTLYCWPRITVVDSFTGSAVIVQAIDFFFQTFLCIHVWLMRRPSPLLIYCLGAALFESVTSGQVVKFWDSNKDKACCAWSNTIKSCSTRQLFLLEPQDFIFTAPASRQTRYKHYWRCRHLHTAKCLEEEVNSLEHDKSRESLGTTVNKASWTCISNSHCLYFLCSLMLAKQYFGPH